MLKLFFVRLLFITMILIVLVTVKYALPKGVRDGFSLKNISSSMTRDPSWTTQVAEEDQEDCRKAFSQSFSYLATGTECHAFISQDGRYVIKFFRHRRWRLHPILSKWPLSSFFKQKKQQLVQRKKGAVMKTFKSCLVAYRRFKAETGLLYLHLMPSHHLEIDLKVTDCLGIAYAIPLDKVDFVLQKKAVRTDEYLLALRRGQHHCQAKKAITAMINFSLKRAKEGYRDTDPHFIFNFGFIDGFMVQVDVGGFCPFPEKGLDYFYGEGLAHIRRKVLPWLEKHYPELTNYVEKEIERIKAQRVLV